MSAPEPDLRLVGARVGYPGRVLLEGLDLTLNPGERVGLVGPNGAGKTTLLKILLGIHDPLAGQVHRREDLRLGFVPQRERFDPVWPLTALEIALQGLSPRRGLFAWMTSDDRAAAEAALDQVGLAGRGAVPFRDLSGGQQQRVLLARALVQEPDWLVLDEPTAGLDVPGAESILRAVEEVRAERGAGVLLVTHQLGEVVAHCDRMLLLRPGHFLSLSVDEATGSDALSVFFGLALKTAEVEGRRVVVPEAVG